MLKQLRQKKTMKRLLWALAILIIPPFAFWGAGSAFGPKGKGPTCAGVIFGKRISFEEYSGAWQAVRNQAMMMYGQNLNQIADQLNLEQQAWERLILLKAAQKARVRVNDSEVVESIARFPFFQSKGRFDQQAYDLVLKQVFRVDPRQFEEEIRGTLAISKLRDSIIKGISMNDDEVEREYKVENEKSLIDYLLVSFEPFKKTATADEAAIKRYYGDNAETFTVPEQVSIEYIPFEFADYQKDIKVTDEEVDTYYKSHKDEFDKTKTEDELKKALRESMVMQKARDAALEAAEKIDYILADKTKSFEETAKENSLPVKETGFFSAQGAIPLIGWFPELQKEAFKLKAGERSGLIKSNMSFAKGFYIIKLKEKKAAYVPTYEDMKEKIENVLKEERAKELARQEANRLYKRLKEVITANKLNFADAAISIRRTVMESEAFSRNGYIKGIGSASELGEQAFTLKPGELSPVAKTRAGFCIFTVKAVMPIDAEKFKKDKEEFAKKALEAKKLKMLQEWYYKLLESANLENNITEEGQQEPEAQQ